MEQNNITELLSNLAFFANPGYSSVRFVGCTYYEGKDKLVLRFMYDQSIESLLEALKPKLEAEARNLVRAKLGDTRFAFEYERRFIDAVLLKLKVKKFFADAFPILMGGMRDITVSNQGSTLHINIKLPKQNIEFVKKSRRFIGFQDGLTRDYFATFNFHFDEVEPSAGDEIDLDALTHAVEFAPRVDKTMKLKSDEYYLGQPIKMRPIKIEFLRPSGDSQVVAGAIQNLTRREFTPKNSNAMTQDTHGATEKKPYWTFILNDGKDTVACVFFPTQKTLAKFEKLVDGTTIAAVGIYSERNGRHSMSVRGVHFCELA